MWAQYYPSQCCPVSPMGKSFQKLPGSLLLHHAVLPADWSTLCVNVVWCAWTSSSCGASIMVIRYLTFLVPSLSDYDPTQTDGHCHSGTSEPFVHHFITKVRVWLLRSPSSTLFSGLCLFFVLVRLRAWMCACVELSQQLTCQTHRWRSLTRMIVMNVRHASNKGRGAEGVRSQASACDR